MALIIKIFNLELSKFYLGTVYSHSLRVAAKDVRKNTANLKTLNSDRFLTLKCEFSEQMFPARNDLLIIAVKVDRL